MIRKKQYFFMIIAKNIFILKEKFGSCAFLPYTFNKCEWFLIILIDGLVYTNQG